MGYCSAGTTCVVAARDVKAFKQAAIDAYREVMGCSEKDADAAYARGEFDATNITDDEYEKGPAAFKQTVKEALTDIAESTKWEVFEKALVEVYAEVVGWSQERASQAYKLGVIGVTNFSQEAYERGLDAFRKDIKDGLESIMRDHKVNQEAFRAMLEKSIESELKNKEGMLRSFLAKNAKLSGKDGSVGQQEPKSLYKHLTENEYRRACIDCFSEFSGVPKKDVERAYDMGFFWRRQMLEELYNKNPAGFRENLKDLYKYQAKMWNRDMDAIRSFFYDGLKLRDPSRECIKTRKLNTEENKGASSERQVTHKDGEVASRD